MRKGFIGPLGDDFPAIFPIALGLMFFFASISIAYDNYNYKADQATLIRANIMISRSARQQSVMTEKYWTSHACPLIEEIQTNYGVHSAMMVARPHYEQEATLSGDVIGHPSEESPFEFLGTIGAKYALCPIPNNKNDDFEDWAEDFGVDFNNPQRPVLTLVYPIVTEVKWDGSEYVSCAGAECEVKPALLVVYTWM